MKELEIQKYLREYDTSDIALLDLKAKYAIESRRHKTSPNLVGFKYSMIESPMGETIVQECRGLILDESNNWAVVARPFDKFFNYGEGHAHDIDWSTARVQEKVDGSLMIVYFYNGSVEVATSGSPDASGEVSPFYKGTFRNLFWDVFNVQKYQASFFRGYPELTFMFELATPYNRIVCNYGTSTLTLLAVRDRRTGEYQELDTWRRAFDVVKEFPLTSFDEILASFASIQGINQEGYVVVDGEGNRVKVKHPQYVALHHLKDKATPKTFTDVVRKGETLELLTAFPELSEQLEDIKKRFDRKVADIEEMWQLYHDIPTKKEFAMTIKDLSYSSILFNLYDGRVSTVREYLANCNIEFVMKLLGIRVVDTDKVDTYPVPDEKPTKGVKFGKGVDKHK